MNIAAESVRDEHPALRGQRMSAQTDILAVIKAEKAKREVQDKDLAELLDISTSQIGRLLSGENNFSDRQIARLFDYFGVRLVTGDQVVIDKYLLDSYIELANRWTEFQNAQRRETLQAVK